MNAAVAVFQMPSDPKSPVIGDFSEHALRVAFVDRPHLQWFPAHDWEYPGVYVLLTGDGTGRVYVGQARQLRTRVFQHHSNEKLPWIRALCVKRDTTDGFNTAQIGYLEGRVAAELSTSENCKVVQGRASGDETLPAHDRAALDSFVKSILGALRLMGILMATENTELEIPGMGVSRDNSAKDQTRVTVGDLVSRGLLNAGEALYLKQGQVNATAFVTADGELLVDGVAYSSPSTAAARALKGQSSNGWRAWRVGAAGGPSLDSLRTEWLEQ